MEKTTGYAVLGCGYFGAEFARAVSQMPGARLAAVYSPGESAGRVSRELGCPRAATLEQIWQDPAVDAVIVATPNYLHKEHVMAAARAGKHVFCEKPFALNTADARAMVECCRAQGVKLMVGHIMHFYSGIARLKTMIDAAGPADDGAHRAHRLGAPAGGGELEKDAGGFRRASVPPHPRDRYPAMDHGPAGHGIRGGRQSGASVRRIR